MTRILESTDYSKFVLHEMNRDIHNTKALEASMKEYGWLDAYPMFVVKNGDGKLKIKAGHHRFYVAKKLKIPVKYVVMEHKLNQPSIQELEATSLHWTIRDYLESFCRQGKQDYIELKEYCDRTKVSLSYAIGMFSDVSAKSGGNKSKKFKDGQFRILTRDLPTKIEVALQELRNMGFGWVPNQSLVDSLCKLFQLDIFDFDTLKVRIAANPGLFVKHNTCDAMLDMIDKIYNHKARTRIPLGFKAREVSKHIQTTFGRDTKSA